MTTTPNRNINAVASWAIYASIGKAGGEKVSGERGNIGSRKVERS